MNLTNIIKVHDKLKAVIIIIIIIRDELSLD